MITNTTIENRGLDTRWAIPDLPPLSRVMRTDQRQSSADFNVSARNILYLESELAYLEAEQDRLDQESKKDHDLTLSMKSWNLLCLQATPPREEPKGEMEATRQRRLQLEAAAQERLQLAWRIREVLRVYRM